MTKDLLVPTIRDHLAKNDIEALRRLCEAEHPASVAEWLSALEPAEIWRILRTVSPELQGEIVSHIDEDTQQELVPVLDVRDAASLLTGMSSDNRADLFRRLPEEQRERLYPALAKAEREDIRKLTSYPLGTAGSIMTSDYVSLQRDMTASQAMQQIRLEATQKDTIYYAYVVDDARTLIGFVSLKDLILARPGERIEDFMHREIICAHAGDDQEDAARKIEKFDLIALPVINGGDALVGIITHDDAIDVIMQEQQEDLEKLMAIRGSHQAGTYLKTSSWVHFKNRMFWVVGLAALGLLSGIIIHGFEGSLMSLMVLALYMPMVADTGGNTGSQSSTVVVRALALGEIKTGDAMRVLFKELQVSLLLGVVLAVLSFGKVMFLSHGTVIPDGFSLWKIGAAIALALGLQVVTATLIGALLPMGAAKLRLDPAVVASPALTTVVDISGLLIYFGTAKMLLGI
ncbi:magnesium transporter [Salidesulfovibrio onnuriiensis]|uniref:magnesium transporter n=1 Tax=Salidesulfovibrio onnuriiensis TaxID=2583823 RepID=UPI0011CB4B06|nr:magnesium transporter [Salidesulfovibrio onnuriiensis]